MPLLPPPPPLCHLFHLHHTRRIADPAAAADLSSWLTSAGICLVAADELRHETAQKDRQQVGLPPGEVRQVLPIALHITQPDFGYVRLHRRHGTTDRLVPQDEIAAWARRLAHLTAAPAPREGQAAQQQQQQQAAGLSGPVYFLWGTDYEDAPLINARALEKVRLHVCPGCGRWAFRCPLTRLGG